MRGTTRRLTGLIVPAVLLATASAAFAAASGPQPGGRYVGKTSQKLAVNVRVAKNGTEFQAGAILFQMQGPRACTGRAFFNVSPTPPPAVKISRSGQVSFKSSFHALPSPGFPFRGNGTVQIHAQFSNHGKLLTGSAKQRLFNKQGSCTSGLVSFTAKLS